jgi:pSer/pThr/pTyr-binding forkhead associated (FHA) protein
MPYLTIGARRHALDVGETTIGGADATLGVPGAPEGAALVAVLREPDGRVSIRRLRADAAVLVDGEPLLAASRALEHGSKIEIHGRTIFYGDARRSAGTEGVAGVSDEQLSPLDAALPPSPAGDTGGRLVSLDTGREWPVPEEGLEIGRDPACDVVVTSSDASRWHATIERTLLGYAVRDASSNGIRVNGARVEQFRLLARGDILRVGREEFRFEADEPSPEPAAPASSGEESLARAPLAVSRGAASPPLLATLEILNEGAHKGERIRVDRALVRIGRSSGADIVFADDSVSGTHATLERRDGAWRIVDHDSTNGSYVDGERFRGTRPLPGAAELRFGNVKLLFRPIAAASITAQPEEPGPAAPTGDTAGTRGIVGVGRDES